MNHHRSAALGVLTIVFVAVLAAPAAHPAATLAVEGICPGLVTLEITGAVPNNDVALVWGTTEGTAEVPGGPCSGLQTGLESINRGNFISVDGNGAASLVLDFPTSGCEIFIQGIDMGNCSVTPLNQSPGSLHFADVTGPAGVGFEQLLDTDIPIGGGAAWADFDGDTWDDLYVTQGNGCNRLFLNDQDGTFTELADAGGASACSAVTHGAAVADYDNDGDQDIYITNNGQNRLFRNRLVENGNLSFVDETNQAKMNSDGARNSSSAAWADYDNDGFLDLAVLQHYTPAEDVCNVDMLWRSTGDGRFEEVASSFGIDLSGDLEAAGCGLALTWSDFDDDGDPDLLIVNDLGYINPPNRLFRNDGPDGFFGGWSFTDVSASSGFDYSMFGMGIAIGDYDRDGDFDYYMSDIGANNLAENQSDGSFIDVAATAGVEAWEPQVYLGDDGLVSWGNLFVDGDLDGWLDLVVANGGAPESKFPGMFGEDYVELNPIFWYQNQTDGTFREGHEDVGIGYEKYYRTIAGSDYDKDGDVDFFAGVAEGFPELYRNDYPQGILNWLEVKVRGSASNRDGIGSRVEILVNGRPQIREIDGGSSFLSRHSLIAHFGIGDADVVETVVVKFPSGTEVLITDVAANQILTVIEP